MKITGRSSFRIWLSLVTCCVFLLSTSCAGHSAEKNKTPRYAMTEADLQTELMGFADRFASYLFQGLHSYENVASMEGSRAIVQKDALLASTSAFTLAAARNPTSALLDMAAMVTMGRLIYEEHWLPLYGDPMRPVVAAYRKGEKDLMAVSGKILDDSQQAALRDLILTWRAENPDHTGFAYMRFGHMAEQWKESGSAEAKKASGLFQSVRAATAQVEEARILAERGMYLATRMPLLSGSFADYWMADFSKNPEVSRLLADLHGLAQTVERLPGVISEERAATVRQSMDEITTWSHSTVSQTMDRVAIEREKALQQFFAELKKERKNAIADLVREEKTVSGLLKEIHATLAEGNKVLTTAGVLAERFAPQGPPSDAPPMNIEDYRATVVEVKETVKELGTLLSAVDQMTDSPRWETVNRLIETSMDQAGKKGESLVDHSFGRGLLLIVAGIVLLLIAQVAFLFIKKRIEHAV